ncbi:hypothetical protein NQ318_002856 [Aromia moschata]|uniref:Uncharacterized protein n=1 Tax=Aromia moschata TaxID=1265417 RepID=A0AAV8XUS8_9CUCU|nr:hypothetical protein NQ318_002856 [Aromia moschata]
MHHMSSNIASMRLWCPGGTQGSNLSTENLSVMVQTMGGFHVLWLRQLFAQNIPLIEELTRRQIKATATIRENRRSNCPLLSNKIFKKIRGVVGTFDPLINGP